MKNTSFGPEKRYATALFDLAQEQGIASMADQVQSLKQAIVSSADLQAFIASAAIPASQKKSVLVKLLEDAKAENTFINFVSLVADNKRADRLASICDAYQALEKDAAGTVTAYVTTATALTSAQEQEVRSFVMQKQTGAKSVDLDVQVDEGLIAGMKIRIDSTEYDATVRGRLDDLRTTLN